jgi:hypothetical protein
MLYRSRNTPIQGQLLFPGLFAAFPVLVGVLFCSVQPLLISRKQVIVTMIPAIRICVSIFSFLEVPAEEDLVL